MFSPEGQHVPERVGETEPVHESESEHGHPAAAQSGRHDVLEGHVDDGSGDHRFHEGNEPEGGGRQSQRGGDQRDGVGYRKGRDEDDQYPNPLKGDNQAQQEQEMVHAVENVGESELYEPKRGLVPAGIERDPSRVPGVLVEPLASIGRQEAQYGRNPHPQPFEAGQDGKIRTIRRDPVFEQRVQHHLLPVDLRALAEGRTPDRGQRGLVRAKGWIRGQGCPDRREFRQGETPAVFVDRHLLSDPEHGGVFQGSVSAGKVQVTGTRQGEDHVLHGLERYPDEQAQALAFRLDERPDGNVAGDVVAVRTGRGHGRHEGGDGQVRQDADGSREGRRPLSRGK